MENTSAGDAEQPKEKVPPIKTAAAYLHDLSYLLATVILVFLLLFRIAVVDGNPCMIPWWTETICCFWGISSIRTPRPGMIVASKQSFADGSPIVKRIIATEGQTVDIDFASGTVYVDGTALNEPLHLFSHHRAGGDPVPDRGRRVLLRHGRQPGRVQGQPLHEIGLIDRREILGKVIFLFLPGTNKGEDSRDFSRIGVVRHDAR